MDVSRAPYRAYKFLRNTGLFFLGAMVVILTVLFPRVFGGSADLSAGPDTASADAPSSCTACASCDPGCGDGGGGDSCGDGK